MTSSIPYDPYDDMDNNPFAEPEEHMTVPETIVNGLEEAAEEKPADTEDNASEDASNDDGNKVVDAATEQEESSYSSIAHEIPIDELLPERKNNKYSLFVQVTGIERAGSLTNKKENPTVKFDCTSNLPTFRKPKHKKLKKTYSEFNKLFKYLNAAIPETFVPALPSPFTSYGINNEEDAVKTAANFQSWLNRITSDPLIIRSDELAIFIESDLNTYTPLKKVSAVSGLKRKTLKQLSPPYDETLPLAEFRPLVKSIYHIAQEIKVKLLKMSTVRRQLSQDVNQFGQAFQPLSLDSSDLYHKFGRVITAIGDIESIVANLDMATLYDPLESIERDSYIIKEALTNRHFVMRELLQAQQTSRQRQENARKLRAKRDINPLKVDESIRQLKESVKNEHELTIKLKRITANMLIEREKWLVYLQEVLAQAIKEFVLRKIEYDRKKLSLLERIRLAVRTADGKGGLSRLGRSSLPTVSSISSSQSYSGDSWTGDKTRTPHLTGGIVTTEFDNAVFSQNNSQSQDPLQEHMGSSPSSRQYTTSEPAGLSARQAASILGDGTF
ncbi:unnamed protein product [Kluyveromyces dobzhanskii CBS 2104]|uniref:Vacuolar protein sorting-associated protein 17 n=1 Tax=Kluyveromyces dobzhanskii CBS 2104 TaxID=1427455 RepID=A0A0A8L7U1_9SACH|nr:unnamed protein product [Kluyveromyces dobzhanskii CBS 2104]